jgi:SAM-dependent methyltransferase
MVHALEEIRRVLVPGGVLIDIRPLADRWPVEVESARGFEETGRVDDLREQVNGDAASNAAMRDVEARGWFRREQEQLFSFFYSWDTPSEMEKFVDEDWSDFIELGEDAKRKTRSAWAIGDADSRVRVRVKILITRWRVRDASQK